MADRLPELPEGLYFHELIMKIEVSSSLKTNEVLKTAGEKAPKTLEHLGTLLSLLYQFATCAWTCAGGDHFFEHLVSRVTTSALAALTLMRQGYYDDALTLVRTVGELANLFVLFGVERSATREWQGLTPEGRWSRLGFERVRQRLREKGAPIPLTVASYREMGARGTHATAVAKPQTYDQTSPGVVGPGILQITALLIILNELSYYVLWVAAPLLHLAALPEDRRKRIKEAALTLEASLGGANLEWLRRGWPMPTSECPDGDEGTPA